MLKNDEKIHFILTGGTIDSKTKNQKRDKLLENSQIPAYLKKLEPKRQFNFTTACWKDSRDITEEDRNNILRAVEESPSTKIIVTHGTYTMPTTARFLKNHLQRKDQTVVLTGSLTPLTGFDNSDAPTNLNHAIKQVISLPRGVYVCISGQIFSPEEVAKDEATGRFYSIFKDKQ
jgi:L-asparaginase